MKKHILLPILLLVFSFGFAQKSIKEIDWSDLKIEKFEKKKSKELKTDVATPIFTKKQMNLDSETIIISGNYHVLDSFDKKTYLLSRDEIIKTPMQRDEVMIITLKEGQDPIYFGRKVKLKGTLVLSKSIEDDSFYSLIDVEKVK